MTDVVPMMDADGQHLESDEELRSLFAAIDDYAIYTLTPEGMIHSWNPGAERLYGWSEAEALTMNRSDMIPSELLKEFSARLEQLTGGANSGILQGLTRLSLPRDLPCIRSSSFC